ncbi:TonB-dependent receptor [Flavivirga sp. 57AJ16]|uniref:SusC/RagA family TonB-linked outer membrane protein n=1 Tax=Flavivirga sp. 57AJ16 TaxID=3025307 RepID=UPI002366F686|nr:TonB-dependent receptor [Flavivirga sp. 57AJ16]MDD7888011.1 TonB-dependent receptor [Flavivirga sp. 57AJ16]
MRTFLFLLCTTAFGFTSSNVLSQNAKINIEANKTVTVDEVFDIIMSQTDYTFIYQIDMFKDFPKVKLEKGVIRANKLLQKSLSRGSFNFNFTTNNTIVINESAPVTLQETTISGQVVGENGMPLAGITVYVTNQKLAGERINQDFLVRGVATDFDGNFSLLAEVGYYLVASGLGYEFYTEQITADKKVYNISLKEKASALDEVLVVGYGTIERKDLTGSVGSVKSEDIQQTKAQTIDQTLGGRIAGVHVSGQTGGPGSGAIVHIRGLSQLRGDNQPLYVVDGVPIVINPQFSDIGSIGVFGDRENPLLSINPADIERVDVLKDASSAAIYGSRAANGVILITTKRGKRNQAPRFNFSYNTTIQNPTNTYDMLNASQFKDFITEQGMDGAITFGNANTDWQEEITNNNAIWNQYDLGVSGGTEHINYLVSARVSDQEGLMLGTKFTRYNFTSSLDATLSERIRVGTNITYNHSTNKRSGLGSLASGAFFRPDLPVFNDDGSYSTAPGSFGLILRNPVGDVGKESDKAISQNILGSVYGEYKIIDGLRFRSQLSVNLNNDRSSQFSPSFTLSALYGAFLGTEGALLDVQHTSGISTSFANTLNYNRTFGDHTIDVVGGVSWDHSRLDLESQSYAGFPDDEILTNINSANDFVSASSDATETALNSIFGRVNYNYKGRYLATFTARSDGSIKFGPDNQRGFFPSGALAWNMHNEAFLKDNDIISQLKLRASMGRTGSDNLPAFSFLATYKSLGNGDSFYDGQNGIAVEGVPNSAIRWEETDQLDFGLEFGLFNGRLNGEISYFEKNTNDIILLVPIPGQTGASEWNANIADVSNTGWEIAVGGDVVRNKNFIWNSSFNISFVKNNVDALKGGQATSFGNTGIIEGEPIGVISGWDVVSIAQTQAEVDALNNGAPDGNYYSGLTQPGDYIYRDVDGDGEITNDDRTVLGDINPEYFGGWNNTITYKDFDFTFNFQFVQGNEKDWQRGANEFSGVNPNNNVTTAVFDTWTPDNTDANYARIGSGTHSSFPSTSKNVLDGSYIKLRSASLGYNFPKEWLKNTGVDNVKLTLSGNNLFTITNYPGIDPESVDSQQGGATVGLLRDGGFSYPQARTFTIGFNLSF